MEKEEHDLDEDIPRKELKKFFAARALGENLTLFTKADMRKDFRNFKTNKHHV